MTDHYQPATEGSMPYRIKQERERIGLSEQELAKRLNINVLKLRYAESHGGAPLDKFKPIHFYLMVSCGMDLNYIFGAEHAAHNEKSYIDNSSSACRSE